MKKIKINFADVGINNSYHKDFILNLLKQDFEVEISKNPDFLFCGEFLGYEYLKYKNCVRIYISGEYEYPDYNTYDYIVGMVDCEQNERYLYYPMYMWRDGTSKYFDMAMQKHKRNYLTKNKLFCNQLISNSVICDSYRFQIYEELSKYKKVDSAGSYDHNISFEVGRTPEDKLNFAQNYKFSLAVENTVRKGYVSEKIIEAWAAGTIPIYYGAEDIEEIFNKDAFINCGKSENICDAVKKVISIDQDDNLYYKMMNEPIVNENSKALRLADKERVKNFLLHILNQSKEEAFRRERSCRGVLLENEKIRLLKQGFYYNELNKMNSANYLEQNINKNKLYNIAVYGKGIVGEALLYKLKKMKNVNVIVIFDKLLYGEEYQEIPIINIEKRIGKKIDCIINTVYGIREDVKKQFMKANDKEVLVLDLYDLLENEYRPN